MLETVATEEGLGLLWEKTRIRVWAQRMIGFRLPVNHDNTSVWFREPRKFIRESLGFSNLRERVSEENDIQ